MPQAQACGHLVTGFTLKVMTKRFRKTLFWLSTASFIVIVIPVILYALGFRIAPDSWELVQAGGLSIASTPSTGTRIYVDGKLERETTIFSRRLFLQGLTPRRYTIRIEKEDYFPWQKVLMVDPERVADAHALLIKDSPEGATLTQGDYASFAFSDITESIITLQNTKKKETFYLLADERVIPKPFNIGTTTPQLSDTAQAFIKEQNIKDFDYDPSLERVVWWDKTHVWVRWLRGDEFLPLYTNEPETLIYASNESPVREARFYPFQEAVLIASSNAVMVVELDGRDKRNIYPLYKGREPRVLVAGNKQMAYILDDGNLIRIPLQ